MPTWTYRGSTPLIINRQSIASAATTAVLPLGTIVRAVSSVGEGEFIYWPLCASAAAGIMLTMKQSASGVASSAATANTANQGRPIGVAMCSGTGLYGFLQISGQAVIKKAAVKVNPAAKIFQSSTAGRITGATASGKQVLNAVATPSATVASTTSTVVVMLDRPFLQGQVV